MKELRGKSEITHVVLEGRIPTRYVYIVKSTGFCKIDLTKPWSRDYFHCILSIRTLWEYTLTRLGCMTLKPDSAYKVLAHQIDFDEVKNLWNLSTANEVLDIIGEDIDPNYYNDL